MEFKLLGGEGGGQESMGSVFSAGVPQLGEILDTAQALISGGLTLAGNRMDNEFESNTNFVNRQMELNAKKRSDSAKRLAMKQSAMGTLESMLGEYDTMIEAMGSADDEESRALLPMMMQGRMNLMNAMRGGMSPASLTAYVNQEKSAGMSPAKRTAQAGEVSFRRQDGEKGEEKKPASGETTKAPEQKKTGAMPSSRTISLN